MNTATLHIQHRSEQFESNAEMLKHLRQTEVAGRIHNAWLSTLEAGIRTAEIYRPEISQRKVGTREFTEAVCERLGLKPGFLKEADYHPLNRFRYLLTCVRRT
jgi:isocitrate dehydrogenase